MTLSSRALGGRGELTPSTNQEAEDGTLKPSKEVMTDGTTLYLGEFSQGKREKKELWVELRACSKTWGQEGIWQTQKMPLVRIAKAQGERQVRWSPRSQDSGLHQSCSPGKHPRSLLALNCLSLFGHLP